MYFYTCDLNLNLTRAELGLDVGFIFHQRVHPKPERNPKNSKLERNLKKTRKNLKPKRNTKKSERNSFTKFDGYPKPDRFRFGC
jgi:hypothetical protein